MEKNKHISKDLILGIDIGSVSISVVCIDTSGSLMKEAYVLHHGNIRMTLEEVLKPYDPVDIVGIASPSGKVQFIKSVYIFDQQVSIMEGLLSLGVNARSILHVGAERFFLIELDEEGNYQQTSHSSSCAAGTPQHGTMRQLHVLMNTVSTPA